MVSMARKVGRSTQLNYQDYWISLSRFIRPDGSLHVRGLFTYQNEHPFLVPQIIYYIDAKLGAGTNHELGYFSILMGIASVLLLAWLLPSRWQGLNRGIWVAALSFVVFCPAGAWNFVRGMSGTAWLTANVFALIAIVFAVRGRTIWAVVFAALALLTYGTGFGAPVALIVIALLRKDKRWQWLLPGGLLFGALVVYKLTAHGGTTGKPLGRDPSLLTQTFLSNLSTLWDSSGGAIGVLAGAAGLIVLAACFAAYWRDQDRYSDLIPWFGVTAYALTAAALISLGRSEVFEGDGAQGRYVSLSALFWIALAVIVVRTVPNPRDLVVRIGVVVAAIAVFWASSGTLVNTAVSQNASQDEIAAGLQVGATDPFTSRVYLPQQQIQRLKALGNYPFVSSYTFGCGLKPGGSIDMSKVKQLPAAMFPKGGSLDDDSITGNTRQAKGWIVRNPPADCVIFVDGSGKIVGAGSAQIPRQDVVNANPKAPLSSGFEAVTPSSQTGATLVLGFADGFFTLPPEAALSNQQSQSGSK